MATNNDINLKITVDANQAQQSTTNYKAKLKELKDQMAELLVETNGLADATDEQRAKYESLAKEAGSLTDALGDVSARIRANADDYQMFNAALEGLKGGAAVAQGLVGTLDLLGLSNSGVEQVVKTLMSLQGIMNSINAVQQVFNKDSKVRIALQKLLSTEVKKTAVAEGQATVAAGALAAGEGVATAASFTLAGACKAVGVAIKSIPVIGWILAAVAALITLTSLIVSCNKEADMGDKIAADILEKDRERKQELDDIARKHQKIAENLQEELDAIVGMDKQERQYKDTISAAAKELGISYEYAEKLYNEDREGLKAKIQLTEDYNASLDKITANEEKQNQARKDREALENRIQEIMAEGYETSQASLDKLVEEGKITEDQQAILQKYRNQRARSEMSLYNAQQSALVVVNSQLSAYQNIEDSCSNQLNTLKNTTKEQKEQINNLQTQSDLYAQEQKDAEEAKRKREAAAAAWKKFKSERDAAQKSYQQSVEDMAIADAEYDKDYDRLLEARKAKRNREYNEELEKYKGQLKSKLITQEQYDALVAASTEKLNNDIAKLDTDNDKRIWDEKVKNLDKESETYWNDYIGLLKEGLEKGFATEKELKDANREKAGKEDKEAAQRLINQYGIEAKEQELAKAKGRVAGLEEGTPEYFDALIAMSEAQRELELEQLEQDKEAKLLSEEDYQIRKKEIIDRYRTENLQAQRDDAQKEIEIKELTYQAIGEIASGLHSTLGSLQEAELADETKSEKEKLQIQKKYAIASLLINIAESGVALATSIPKTLEAYADIPVAGPIIAAIQIAATTAAIIAQIAKIRQFQQQINKAARGAYVVGPSHSQGGVPYELEGGEIVLNKNVAKVPQFRAIASAMNVATGGVALGGGGVASQQSFGVTKEDVQSIVAETVAGIAAIPVVVSAQTITETQRRVNVTQTRSQI